MHQFVPVAFRRSSPASPPGPHHCTAMEAARALATLLGQMMPAAVREARERAETAELQLQDMEARLREAMEALAALQRQHTALLNADARLREEADNAWRALEDEENAGERLAEEMEALEQENNRLREALYEWD